MKRLVCVALVSALAMIFASEMASAQTGKYLYRDGFNIFIENDPVPLSDREAYDFFGDYNYANTYTGAIKQYRIGRNLTIAGGAVLGGGLTVLIIGAAICEDYVMYTGAYTMVFGNAMMAAGVPLLCVGKGRLNWLVDDYNQRIERTPEVCLNFGVTRSGLGFTINF